MQFFIIIKFYQALSNEMNLSQKVYNRSNEEPEPKCKMEPEQKYRGAKNRSRSRISESHFDPNNLLMAPATAMSCHEEYLRALVAADHVSVVM